MVKYYHVHRSKKKSKIEKKFQNDKQLYFSKKDSAWYEIEKNIGLDNFGGYIIYEIDIPKRFFTYSFNPTSKNKIVKVNDDNLEEFLRLKSENIGSIKFIEEMKRRNLIGVDSTYVDLDKIGNYAKEHKIELFLVTPFEGYIWKKTNGIKISVYKVSSNK